MHINMPVPVSPTVQPGLTGGPPNSPVTLIVPPAACAIIRKRGFLVGAAFAKAFDLAMDDAWIDGLQHIIAEAKTLDCAQHQIFGEHVG